MLPRMAVNESHLFWYIVFVLVLFCAARVATGDVVVLNDGTQLTGKVHYRGDHLTVEDASGKETDIPVDQVKSFTVGNSGAGQNNLVSAQEELTSLQHASENLADPNDVVGRYQRLIASLPAGAILHQAKSDLAVWQDRVSQHEVKVGQRWITQDGRQRMRVNEFQTGAP